MISLFYLVARVDQAEAGAVWLSPYESGSSHTCEEWVGVVGDSKNLESQPPQDSPRFFFRLLLTLMLLLLLDRSGLGGGPLPL